MTGKILESWVILTDVQQDDFDGTYLLGHGRRCQGPVVSNTRLLHAGAAQRRYWKGLDGIGILSVTALVKAVAGSIKLEAGATAKVMWYPGSPDNEGVLSTRRVVLV